MSVLGKTVAIALCLLALVVPIGAGERGPGKYAGIVVFDRWDGCTLYSGIYLMYVSEKAKEALRPYAGKAVLLDANAVYQPHNPGDGLIRKCAYLGPAPTEGRNWVSVDGLGLRASGDVDKEGKITVTMVIANSSKDPIKVFSGELALTALTKRDPNSRFDVADGPSWAMITRQSFESGGSEPRWEGGGLGFTWGIGKENTLPHDFTLAPNTERVIKVLLDLPEGEYDFLFGYAGGVHETKCLASNLVAFDVDNQHKAKLVKPKGRAQPTSAPDQSSPS